MIHHFDADDAAPGLGPMLLAVGPERGRRHSGADDQHFLHAGQRIGDVPVELVLGAPHAAVLGRVMGVHLDPVGLHVFGIELKYLGALVIDADDGVDGGHENDSFRNGKSASARRPCSGDSIVARPCRPGLIPVNAGAPRLPRVGCMDSWIEVAKWLAIAVGAVAAIGALIVGILTWFLNHPD
jgi:hypothetical protein